MRKAVVNLVLGWSVFFIVAPVYADLIEVTDSAGNILDDSLGNPMSATGSPLEFVSFITNFTVDPSAIRGVDLPFTDATNVLKANVDLFVWGDITGGPSHWAVSFFSAINTVQCNPNQYPNCMPATGGLQDLTPLFFTNDSTPPFHVNVQVDVGPVPEPSTALLLAAGLGGIAAVRRRMPSAA